MCGIGICYELPANKGNPKRQYLFPSLGKKSCFLKFKY